MSYLDLPRLHFGGTFQASPSTVNNTPNNYDPAFQTPEKTELYWAPDGNGIFDFIDCSVTSLVGDNAQLHPEDELSAQPVTAIYTKAPPKIVDLDPMQQNVSEIWGVNLQIGHPAKAHVSGTLKAVPFSGIWQNAQGKESPHDSSSGAASFQSVLTNLRWQAGDSVFLNALQKLSPDRLSVKLVLSAHNNHSPSFLFDEDTLAKIKASGVEGSVVDKLSVLSLYRQMNSHVKEPGAPATHGTKAGLLPTRNYVYHKCLELIGEQATRAHIDKIAMATMQVDDSPRSPFEFNHGSLIASVGPSHPDEPCFYTPARTLAIHKDKNRHGPSCNYATAQTRGDLLTLDFGNSLPVAFPGERPWEEALGELWVAYGQGDECHRIDKIPYVNANAGDCRDSSASDFISKRAGIIDIDISNNKGVLESPLKLFSKLPGEDNHTVLQEDQNGFSMRANQFVFRMNPEVPVDPAAEYHQGNSQQLEVCVRKFGRPPGGLDLNVKLHLLCQSDAQKYTRGTVGTSGSAGIKNLSVPEAPDASIVWDHGEARVDDDGIARFQLTAKDPGNPRGYLDGQIYFIRYQLEGEGCDSKAFAMLQDPNNLVSIQIYDVPNIKGKVTWDNGIGVILKQFGYLYPVMARIGLSDHAQVKTNASMIKGVLKLPITHPLHMPVTRDLSLGKRQLIIDWLDAGAP